MKALNNTLIKTCIFQDGDFLILISDLEKKDAPLWKVEGKASLQKYKYKSKDKVSC